MQLLKFPVFITSLVLACLGAGCASRVAGNSPSADAGLSMQAAVTTLQERPAMFTFQGAPYLVRYSGNNSLTARNLLSGREADIAKESPEKASLNGLAAYADAKRMFVAWRPKLVEEVAGLGQHGSKFIYIAASDDGASFTDTQRISNGGGAFPAILTGNGLGDIYALWQDERSGNNYDLYFNVSHDEGRSWKKTETRMDPGPEGAGFSAEPTMLAEGNNIWVTWPETTRVGEKLIRHLYVRSSSDRGDTWNEPIIVTSPENQAVFPQLLRVGKQLQIYWYDTEGVKAASSSDDGKSWAMLKDITKPSRLEELHASADSKGVVHLLFGIKAEEDSGSLTNMFYSRSDDGAHFSPALRLNESPEFKSLAWLANLGFDSSGNMLAAWADHRYFRSVIMGKVSQDGGLTWGNERMLGDGPDNGVSQLPAVLGLDNGFLLSYQRYRADALTQASTKVIKVEPVAQGATLPPAADLSKLGARVEQWWGSRVDANWGKSYDLMDPFIRARTDRNVYIKSQGTVKYHDFKIEKIEPNGERRAIVTLKYTSEVPRLEIYGRVIDVPKKESETTQEWIWIDGNWYFLFLDLYGKNFMDN